MSQQTAHHDSHDTDGGAPRPGLQKDPDEWVTGDEAMTAAQASYLKTLSTEAGEEFDPDLTKAEASKRIDALRDKTGRGTSGPGQTAAARPHGASERG